VDTLLEAAEAFRKSNEIRSYVANLGARLDRADQERIAQYEAWSAWALAQADRIDPALKSSFAGWSMNEGDAQEGIA